MHALVHQRALVAEHGDKARARRKGEVALHERRLLLRDERPSVLLSGGGERGLDRVAERLHVQRRGLVLDARARRWGWHRRRFFGSLLGALPGFGRDLARLSSSSAVFRAGASSFSTSATAWALGVGVRGSGVGFGGDVLSSCCSFLGWFSRWDQDPCLQLPCCRWPPRLILDS